MYSRITGKSIKLFLVKYLSLVTIFCIYVFFIFSPSSRRHPYPFWYRFYNKLSNGTSIEKFVLRYLEKSLRASADPRSPMRQGPLPRVAAGPRVVMAQSGVQANVLAKQPLPLGVPLGDLPVSPPQISPARRGFLEC